MACRAGASFGLRASIVGGSDCFVLKRYVVSAYGTKSPLELWLPHRKFFENQALDHYGLDPETAWGGPLRNVAKREVPPDSFD
jgi:hypothetical protein